MLNYVVPIGQDRKVPLAHTHIQAYNRGLNSLRVPFLPSNEREPLQITSALYWHQMGLQPIEFANGGRN